MNKHLQRILKRYTEREVCGAYAVTSEARCRKTAVPFTKYCWQHESKLWAVVSGLIGFFTWLIPAIWSQYHPSAELVELRAWRDQKSHFQLAIRGVHGTDTNIVLTGSPFDFGANRYSAPSNDVLLLPLKDGAFTLRLSLGNVSPVPARDIEVHLFLPPYVKVTGGANQTDAPPWRSVDASLGGGQFLSIAYRVEFSLLSHQAVTLPDIVINPGGKRELIESIPIRIRASNSSNNHYHLLGMFYAATNFTQPYWQKVDRAAPVNYIQFTNKLP